MRFKVQQTKSASKTLFWIVRDTDHPWLYHGPFADDAAARTFARAKNSEAWKELLRTERAKRKAMALAA